MKSKVFFERASKICLVLLLALVIVSPFSSIQSTAFAAPVEFKGTWTSGGIGGSWFTQAAGIAEIINRYEKGIVLKAVPGGGVANPPRVNSGEVEFGWALTPVLTLAKKGIGPFEEPCADDIRVIAESFMDNPYNFLVGSEKKINTIPEFIQKITNGEVTNVTVAHAMTTEGFLLSQILDFYDLSYEKIRNNGSRIFEAGYDEQTDAIMDKRADYWLICMGYPAPQITRASASRELKFISYPEELLDHLYSNFGFARYTIPVSAYPDLLTEEMICPQAGSTLVANVNTPDEVVYAITKILCEHAEEIYAISPQMKSFKPETAGANASGLPFHPGAAKYYEENGYVKEGNSYIKK